MKKLFLLTLILLITLTSLSAEAKEVILKSEVKPGNGVLEPEEDEPTIGGKGFHFYFVPQEDNVLEHTNNSITLKEDITPDEDGSVSLNAFYSGNEGIGVNSNVGHHTVAITAEPWKRSNSEGNDTVNENSIIVKANPSTSDELISITASTEADVDNAYIEVDILSRSLINNKQIGTYVFSWNKKSLAAGEYAATLRISIGAQ